jgi:NAD(P)H-dependent FMN reductase
MNRPDVVAISGSRREGSYTRRALGVVLAAAEAGGADTHLVDLRELDLPPFDPDAEEGPAVRDLKRRVRRADGVVLGTPVYHGSYASTLKDALDYCGSDEFEETAVGLLAVAGGGSYASTLDHLRVVVRTVHGRSIPHQVGIRGASGVFDGDDPTDEDIADRLRTLGRDVTRHATVDPTLPVEERTARTDD